MTAPDPLSTSSAGDAAYPLSTVPASDGPGIRVRAPVRVRARDGYLVTCLACKRDRVRVTPAAAAPAADAGAPEAPERVSDLTCAACGFVMRYAGAEEAPEPARVSWREQVASLAVPVGAGTFTWASLWGGTDPHSPWPFSLYLAALTSLVGSVPRAERARGARAAWSDVAAGVAAGLVVFALRRLMAWVEDGGRGDLGYARAVVGVVGPSLGVGLALGVWLGAGRGGRRWRYRQGLDEILTAAGKLSLVVLMLRAVVRAAATVLGPTPRGALAAALAAWVSRLEAEAPAALVSITGSLVMGHLAGSRWGQARRRPAGAVARSSPPDRRQPGPVAAPTPTLRSDELSHAPVSGPGAPSEPAARVFGPVDWAAVAVVLTAVGVFLTGDAGTLPPQYAVPGILACAWAAFRVRTAALLAYGALELFVGLALGVFAVVARSAGVSPAGGPAAPPGAAGWWATHLVIAGSSVSGLLGFLGAVYVLVRGLDNVGKAIREPAPGPAEERLFRWLNRGYRALFGPPWSEQRARV